MESEVLTSLWIHSITPSNRIGRVTRRCLRWTRDPTKKNTGAGGNSGQFNILHKTGVKPFQTAPKIKNLRSHSCFPPALRLSLTPIHTDRHHPLLRFFSFLDLLFASFSGIFSFGFFSFFLFCRAITITLQHPLISYSTHSSNSIITTVCTSLTSNTLTKRQPTGTLLDQTLS